MTQNPLDTTLIQGCLVAPRSSLGLSQLVVYLTELQDMIASLGDDAEAAGLIPKEQNAFNMVYNSIRITTESIHHYEKEWPDHIAGMSEQRVQQTYQEFIERIGELIKFSFIRTLSYIEYTAKERIRATNNPAFDNIRKALEKGDPVSLGWIINASKTHGIFDDTTHNEWEGMNALRNCIVHNNGYADSTKIYQVDSLTLEFSSGKT